MSGGEGNGVGRAVAAAVAASSELLLCAVQINNSINLSQPVGR